MALYFAPDPCFVRGGTAFRASLKKAFKFTGRCLATLPECETIQKLQSCQTCGERYLNEKIIFVCRHASSNRLRYSAYSGHLKPLHGTIHGGVHHAPPFGHRIDICGNLGAFAKRFGGQMRLAFGGVDRGMTKQILDLIN